MGEELIARSKSLSNSISSLKQLKEIPFLIIVGFVMLQSFFEKLEGVMNSILAYGNGIHAICLIVSIVVMAASYCVAVLCYKKRC